MEFAHPLNLLFLLLIPVLVFLNLRPRKKVSHPLSHLWNRQTNKPQTFASFKKYLPLVVRCLAITCMVIAVSRPQRILGEKMDSSEALDMILAIDTSGSMRALDFKLDGDVVDRLSAIKSVLDKFISERSGDRLGLVVFGEDAFTQAPLTLDHQLLRQLISKMFIGMAGDATAIGDALATSSQRLVKIEAKSKIIILLTDGQNTAGVVEPALAAKAAASLGIKIYTIGIGQDGKVPIPVQTAFGQQIVYQELSLDEGLLKSIAEETGGQYFRAYNTKSLNKIYSEIDKLEKTKIDVKKYVEREELFPSFVYAGLFFIFLSLLLTATRWRII